MSLEKNAFGKRLFGDAKKFIATKENRQYFHQWFALYNKGDKKGIVKLQQEIADKRSAKDEFFNILRFFYFEIIESRDRILLAKYLINKTPPKEMFKKLGITHDRYLRYHIEYILSEVYLVKERIRKNEDKIIGQLEKRKLVTQRQTLLTSREKFLSAIANIIQARESHVHSKRFFSDEFEDIENLEYFSNVSKGGNIYTYLHKQKYRDIKKNWVAIINQIAINLEKVLDVHFNEIEPIVFKSLLDQM